MNLHSAILKFCEGDFQKPFGFYLFFIKVVEKWQVNECIGLKK